MEIKEYLPTLILVLGIVTLLAGLFLSLRSRTSDQPQILDELAQWKEAAIRTETQAADREQRLMESDRRFREDQERIVILSEKVSSLESDLSNEKRRLEEFHAQRKEETERLTREFENLANRILDQNSKKITSLQEEKIGQLLQPVSQKLMDFQQSVVDLKAQGISHQAEFKTQLENLRQTSTAMTEEAQNLTRALQGQKTQGLWGEFILERVLETSGLQKGQEYQVQESHSNGASRLQPDVIVYLPENKHLIIDAKVSLTAFLRFNQSTNESDRKSAVKEHLFSLRSHIDSLSNKRYDSIKELRSPEIVLLFVPIEPAFIEALREDPSLFDYAFHRKVVLVTPTTLLATLKTVASIWRQEKQNKNALEIARLGGELYDKFVGFTQDMDEVGDRIEQARLAHDAARSKLVTGKGNAVRTIQRMKDLGLKTKKDLNSDHVDRAIDADS